VRTGIALAVLACLATAGCAQRSYPLDADDVRVAMKRGGLTDVDRAREFVANTSAGPVYREYLRGYSDQGPVTVLIFRSTRAASRFATRMLHYDRGLARYNKRVCNVWVGAAPAEAPAAVIRYLRERCAGT